jgi:type I restriction enzyme, S subunit
MNNWPKVMLGEIISTVERAEAPIIGRKYRQIGVKLWGEGAYERDVLDGGLTKYAKLFRVEADDIIVNKIWARNGSVAVVSEALSGCYGSAEFPMFKASRDQLEPRWIHWLTKTKSFWEKCDEKSQGTSGKNRIRPERFLDIEILLPPLEEQRWIVARIEELAAQIHEAGTLRKRATEEAEAVITSARANLFGAISGDRIAEFDTVVIQLRGASGLPLKEYLSIGKYPVIDQGKQPIAGYCNDEYRVLHPPSPVVVWGDHTTNVKLVDFDFMPGADGTKVFLPREDILASFLFQFLKSIKYPDLGYSRHYRYLKGLKIPVPKITEQRRIVAELNTLQTEVDRLKHLQAETAAELNTLLPAILDRAFRGELL